MRDEWDDGEDEGFCWPDPADSLAPVVGKSGEEAERVAIIDWPPMGNAADRYVRGYADAAMVLVRHALRFRSGRDTLVYPILFIFRHHVELGVKRVIELAYQLHGCEEQVPTTHNLQTLWQEASRQVHAGGRKVTPRAEGEWRAVGRCIKQLDDMDAQSEASRYPVDTSGNEQVLRSPFVRGGKRQPVTHVNLRALRDRMAKIMAFLDGLAMMLDHELEVKAEMEADARSYAADYSPGW